LLKLNHFHFSNLETIYLDKNFIVRIDGLGQAKMPKLHTLSLQGNQLVEVNFAQADLPALTKFDIRNNKIEKVFGLGTSNTFNLKFLEMGKYYYDFRGKCH
jgi:Leucine-rich repeat (LRR) protein